MAEIEYFLSKTRSKIKCPLSTLLFNIVLEILAKAIWQEKEIEGMGIGKEDIKLSLFKDDRIINVGKPKESIQKTNQQESSTNTNITGFQDIRSTHTNQSHFYILAMYNWKPKCTSQYHLQ